MSAAESSGRLWLCCEGLLTDWLQRSGKHPKGDQGTMCYPLWICKERVRAWLRIFNGNSCLLSLPIWSWPDLGLYEWINYCLGGHPLHRKRRELLERFQATFSGASQQFSSGCQLMVRQLVKYGMWWWTICWMDGGTEQFTGFILWYVVDEEQQVLI